MTNREAIEILTENPVAYPDPDAQAIWDEAMSKSIAALEKQVEKNPIGVKLPCVDAYTEVADIVDDWCQKNYYSSAFVTLSLDGRVTTEYLSFDGYNMDFAWDMDWWEGEKNVVLLGFRMINDVAFYGYPEGGD